METNDYDESIITNYTNYMHFICTKGSLMKDKINNDFSNNF